MKFKDNLFNFFSVLLITCVLGIVFMSKVGVYEAASGKEYDGNKYVNEVTIRSGSGTIIEDGDHMYYGYTYLFNMTWGPLDNIYEEGDTLIFTLPKVIDMINEHDFNVYSPDNQLIGVAHVVGSKVDGFRIELEFTTDYVENYSDITGQFNGEFKINEVYVNEGDKVIKFPNGDLIHVIITDPGGGDGTGSGNVNANKKVGELKVNEETHERYIEWGISLGRNTLLGQADSFDEIEQILISDEPVDQILINNIVEWWPSWGWEKAFFTTLGFDYGGLDEEQMGIAKDRRSLKADILPRVLEYEEKAEANDSEFKEYDFEYWTQPLDLDTDQEVVNKAQVEIIYKDKTKYPDDKWVLKSRTEWFASGGSAEGRRGSVELVKLDADDRKNHLSGAIFDLYNIKGTRIKSDLTTDKNGEIKVTDLPIGKYYFIETKAPDGYVLPENNKFEFEITSDSASNGALVPVAVENKKKTSDLILEKTDSKTKKPMPNVEFMIQVLRSNGNWDSDYLLTGVRGRIFKTDQNGQIIINDKTYPGLVDEMIDDYENNNNCNGFRFREIKSLPGYNDPQFKAGLEKPGNPGDKFSVGIDMDKLASGATQQLKLDMTNERVKNSITVSKKDEISGKALPGAEFMIQALRANGNWDSNYVLTGVSGRVFKTDQNGQIIINDTTYPGLIDEMIDDYETSSNVNQFRFREIKAPNGYVDPQFKAGLEKPGNPGDQFSSNIDIDSLITGTHPDLEIVVKNKRDNQNIVVEKRDAETGNLITDSEATFIIQELKAPDNSGVKPKEWKQLTLGANKPTEFTTTKGVLTITDQEIIKVLMAQKNDLRFREVVAPKGYDDPHAPQPLNSYEAQTNEIANQFSVTFSAEDLINDNRTLTLVMENTKSTYELEINKVDSSGTLLSGAEFKLTPSDNKYETIVSKGEKGVHQFKPLYYNVKYTLTETNAPIGFVLDDRPYDIIVTPVGEATVTRDGKTLVEGQDYVWDKSKLSLSFDIVNNRFEMPVTGGMGIWAYIIVGLSLVGISYKMYEFKLK